eukprot:TRINITY_DN2337_c0_g1_i2.p1 TRINITY_DN2337_c0_g1~~TRINITY_DN2337_c0_g1_i2.p1  ORF type:complete len:307 (-),score=72.33 TRINITY_DN2337_c0_g1_i2:74-994(-)
MAMDDTHTVLSKSYVTMISMLYARYVYENFINLSKENNNPEFINKDQIVNLVMKVFAESFCNELLYRQFKHTDIISKFNRKIKHKHKEKEKISDEKSDIIINLEEEEMKEKIPEKFKNIYIDLLQGIHHKKNLRNTSFLKNQFFSTRLSSSDDILLLSQSFETAEDSTIVVDVDDDDALFDPENVEDHINNNNHTPDISSIDNILQKFEIKEILIRIVYLLFEDNEFDKFILQVLQNFIQKTFYIQDDSKNYISKLQMDFDTFIEFYNSNVKSFNNKISTMFPSTIVNSDAITSKHLRLSTSIHFK